MPVELHVASSRPRADVRPTTRFVLFSVGDVEYAVEATAVRRFLPAGDAAGGAAVFGGNTYPLVDLRARFRMPAAGAARPMLLVEGRRGGAGVLVDAVLNVVQVQTDAIVELPETFAGAERRWFRGLARLGDRVLVIVDVEGLLP